MQRHLEVEMDPSQDPFGDSVSSILERKVRSWLFGVIDDMRRSSPVQQWLDSLPSTTQPEPTESEPTEEETETKVEVKSEDSKADETLTGNTVIEPCKESEVVENKEAEVLEVPNKEIWKRKSLESGVLTSTPQRAHAKKLQRDHSIQSEGYTTKFKNPLFRDHSLQSDASGSSGSSVLNVLGARKVDAESVLIALGFGPSEKQQKLQRIPDRFLAPSKLKGISTEKFIKDEQHSMRMHDCGVFGYRGLTGQILQIQGHFHTSYASTGSESERIQRMQAYAALVFCLYYADRVRLLLSDFAPANICIFKEFADDVIRNNIGNPHVPPSTIVAKIMECILQDDVTREEALMKARHSIADMRSQSNVYAAILASRSRR